MRPARQSGTDARSLPPARGGTEVFEQAHHAANETCHLSTLLPWSSSLLHCQLCPWPSFSWAVRSCAEHHPIAPDSPASPRRSASRAELLFATPPSLAPSAPFITMLRVPASSSLMKLLNKKHQLPCVSPASHAQPQHPTLRSAITHRRPLFTTPQAIFALYDSTYNPGC